MGNLDAGLAEAFSDLVGDGDVQPVANGRERAAVPEFAVLQETIVVAQTRG